MINTATLVVALNYIVFMLALVAWAIADIMQFMTLGAAIESPEIQGIIYLAVRIAQVYTLAAAFVLGVVLMFGIIERAIHYRMVEAHMNQYGHTEVNHG